ncbi:MAG: DUF4340 domain-containing protein [Anaerolineales bacterium]
MVRRPTWILLVVFVFLIGFTLLFQRYQSNKADNTATSTPTSPGAALYNLTNTQVNEVKIADTTGDKIDLYLDPGTSNWAIADVPVNQADTFQIESISAQLFSLQVEETLTQTPPLDSIGLDTPAYTISMTTSDGSQLITYVGTQTAIGSGYYVRVDSGQVVIVDKVVMDDVLNLLKNPPLLPTATPDVSALETASPIEPGSQATPTP